MKIAVCDDNLETRKYIFQLIKKQANDCEVFLFASSEEMLKSQYDFEISFLDIKMGEISGIDLAKQIREDQENNNKNKSLIIFITSYREFMEEAFDVNAFHFISKPINENKFMEVFSKALKEINNVNNQLNKFIIVKHFETKRKVYLKDIFYVESSNKQVSFHTIYGNLKIYETMDNIEKELGDTFFRIHRFYLVNMEKIIEYTSNNILLSNGDNLIIAEKKYSGFVKAFMRYAKNGGIVNV